MTTLSLEISTVLAGAKLTKLQIILIRIDQF